MDCNSFIAASYRRKSVMWLTIIKRKRRAWGCAAAKPAASRSAAAGSTPKPYSKTRIAASSERGATASARRASWSARSRSAAAEAISASAKCAASVLLAVLSAIAVDSMLSALRLSGIRLKTCTACAMPAFLSLAASICLRNAVARPLVCPDAAARVISVVTASVSSGVILNQMRADSNAPGKLPPPR